MEIELMNAVAHNGGDLQKGGGGCMGGGRWVAAPSASVC